MNKTIMLTGNEVKEIATVKEMGLLTEGEATEAVFKRKEDQVIKDFKRTETMTIRNKKTGQVTHYEWPGFHNEQEVHNIINGITEATCPEMGIYLWSEMHQGGFLCFADALMSVVAMGYTNKQVTGGKRKIEIEINRDGSLDVYTTSQQCCTVIDMLEPKEIEENSDIMSNTVSQLHITLNKANTVQVDTKTMVIVEPEHEELFKDAFKEFLPIFSQGIYEFQGIGFSVKRKNEQELKKTLKDNILFKTNLSNTIKKWLGMGYQATIIDPLAGKDKILAKVNVNNGKMLLDVKDMEFKQAIEEGADSNFFEKYFKNHWINFGPAQYPFSIPDVSHLLINDKNNHSRSDAHVDKIKDQVLNEPKQTLIVDNKDKSETTTKELVVSLNSSALDTIRFDDLYIAMKNKLEFEHYQFSREKTDQNGFKNMFQIHLKDHPEQIIEITKEKSHFLVSVKNANEHNVIQETSKFIQELTEEIKVLNPDVQLVAEIKAKDPKVALDLYEKMLYNSQDNIRPQLSLQIKLMVEAEPSLNARLFNLEKDDTQSNRVRERPRI